MPSQYSRRWGGRASWEKFLLSGEQLTQAEWRCHVFIQEVVGFEFVGREGHALKLEKGWSVGA